MEPTDLPGDVAPASAAPAAALAVIAVPPPVAAARLLVFARPPVRGRVKTRLAATLGAEAALGIYRRLLALTHQAVVAAAVPATVWLAEAPGAASANQKFVNEGVSANNAVVEGIATEAVAVEEAVGGFDLPDWPGLPWRLQPPAADLGQRLSAAFAAAFAEGAAPVAVIGTDCPGLTASLLTQAFAALATHDVALGPAADGGYYLLALRRPCPALFESIAWSSPVVLAQTRAAAAALNLTVALLPELHDVDTADDLAHWPGWQG